MSGGLTGRRWWWAGGLVLLGALVATVPTTGDLGLTWDEPSYRYSQVMSAQWWERLGQARSWADLSALVEPKTLLYYWPYGRYGINFHPPLAGQANLLTHAILGRWWKDIPARRIASVVEYALAITILFGFLASRAGPWVGGVAAGALLVMPRVYGDGHLAATDMPGMLLWGATAIAFWKGLYDQDARRWRVLVGVLMGLAFLEKMAAVAVVLPLVVWLVVGHLPRTINRRGGWRDWVDGLVTTAALLLPLGVAFREVHRLSRLAGVHADLFTNIQRSPLPGAILLVPLGTWVMRRLMAKMFSRHPIWGVERPALETWTAILAIAPAIGWLGNPAWWRETLPRLGHYYAIVTNRKEALPDITILYLGDLYQYNLPWHNGWVWIAVTVPVGILIVSLLGILYAFRVAGRDRLPLYFVVHLVTLPVLRMLPTPAHDGVRLLLPSFFFLAGLAGWGLVWLAEGLAAITRLRAGWIRAGLAVLVLGTAAGQLVAVHPYELSYYNELIGGAPGAWRRGFELSYWYDAINPQVLDEVNAALPEGAPILHPDAIRDDVAAPPTFLQLQELGALRADLKLGGKPGEFFSVWLLTQDAKAVAWTRLLFAMKPWYASRPEQLGGLRVVSILDPVTVSRAWALRLLADAPAEPVAPPVPPEWVRRFAPGLGLFWGSMLHPAPKLQVNESLFTWARTDPEGLRAAARAVAGSPSSENDPRARRLREVLTRFDRPGRSLSDLLLRVRPEALVEAVEVLIAHPDEVRTALLRPGYAEPERGTLDRDLPAPGAAGSVSAPRSDSSAERSRRSRASRPIIPTISQRASSKATPVMAAASQKGAEAFSRPSRRFATT